MFGKDNEPLKVGLVLSGGGAKGIAHIGVLKSIEKAGLQIDYLGGTSIGAIVGGLYAAGYTAKELDSIFTTTDLVTLVQDDYPRSAKSILEKEADKKYAVTLPFKNFKVSLPKGFSGGTLLYNELARLLYEKRHVSQFDQLPIPFVCVAANIETGEPIVLDTGYLPEAMVASGSLPSVFQPSELEGQVVIDGGVINNFPLEEVKKMGANYIIGVDVQDNLVDKDSLNSATDILFQVNNYFSVKDMLAKKKDLNIYIKPDITNYTVLSFDRCSDIMKEGEIAAARISGKIRGIGNETTAKQIIRCNQSNTS